TPSAVSAAFAMGAAYVLTGSVNQSAIESGLSSEGRALLAQADVSDMTMAPAADMFELGVKVQVLKRGTMFSNRAAQLYTIYSENSSIDTIPSEVKTRLERDVFSATLEKIWEDTRAYFLKRDPAEVEKAEKNPKHLMALVFRWYLGNSALWAIKGDSSHLVDFQICCGPSMGAFNNWVRGSYLENPENRSVVGIALNLLEGAAVVTRAQQARSYGVPVPGAAFDYRPRQLQ
ncbi:MAG: 2-nitropropane dioxygenase, partial [Proteobacteria bacterium]|nr:2-nitropropane dioxygenase [Pseudomonadota bacterium]